MGGDSLVKFLNLVAGFTVLSLPVLIIAYTARQILTGRWRYTTRTLLIAMTLVAAALGLVAVVFLS
jgi:hypothetical protein